MPHSLVTGGAGFIGSHLVEALLARGERVTVYDDLSTGCTSNLNAVRDDSRLSIVLDSIANVDHLLQCVEEADTVYHLAAVVGVQLVLEQPERTASTNVGPTEAMLRHLATCPKPLFLASTSEVYGKGLNRPLSEDDDLILGNPTRSRWIYACSKALDEYLALAWHHRSGLPVVIGRFFNVVGPRQIGRYGMVLPRFVDQAITGGPLVVYGDGSQVRCFAHVADVIRGILALMDCHEARGRIFNLGSDIPVSIRELAETVARAVDPSLAIEHIAYDRAYPVGFEEIANRVPDLTRIRQTIGYAPQHNLDDIIREVLAWKISQISS